MANIIRQPGQETTLSPDLIKTDFGSKVAVAAANAALDAHQKVEHKTPGHSRNNHQPNLVELREEETRQIIGLSGGSVTGAQLKSNKQLTAKTATLDGEVDDAWTDPNKVKEEDDILTALKKLSNRGGQEQATEGLDEKPLLDLHEIDGLNNITQVVREFGNFGYLAKNPELVILMTGGLSESVDNLLNSKGVDVQDPVQLTSAELQFIFGLMQSKKKKILTEEEKEAELILAGAVTILAIPEILKKLEELGIDPRKVRSLSGELAKLVAEASKEDSTYHNLYLLIKEEAELSILPPEEEVEAAA